jgi:hypothetical protein
VVRSPLLWPGFTRDMLASIASRREPQSLHRPPSSGGVYPVKTGEGRTTPLCRRRPSQPGPCGLRSSKRRGGTCDASHPDPAGACHVGPGPFFHPARDRFSHAPAALAWSAATSASCRCGPRRACGSGCRPGRTLCKSSKRISANSPSIAAASTGGASASVSVTNSGGRLRVKFLTPASSARNWSRRGSGPSPGAPETFPRRASNRPG